MNDQQFLGKLCPYSNTCPVYLEELVVERTSTFLIKNVFCNRGFKGWKNCERYRLVSQGIEVSLTATPYKNETK